MVEKLPNSLWYAKLMKDRPWGIKRTQQPCFPGAGLRDCEVCYAGEKRPQSAESEVECCITLSNLALWSPSEVLGKSERLKKKKGKRKNTSHI